MEILESREESRKETLSRMIDAFNSMDNDQSGTISKDEFKRAISEDVKVQECLVELGLDNELSLFDTLDAERTEDITFDNFFDGTMLITKGQETAKAKDIVGTHLLAQ